MESSDGSVLGRASPPRLVDEFERILTKVVNHFISLQNWSKKQDELRKVDGIYPVILALDGDLKVLRKMDKAHPLQDLVSEVRTSFDTKEFRAVLLSAFNWRSAARKAREDSEARAGNTSNRSRSGSGKKRLSQSSDEDRAKKMHVASAHRPSCAKNTKKKRRVRTDPSEVKKLSEQILAFLKSAPPLSRRAYQQIIAPKLAYPRPFWCRVPGSYGANQ